MAYKISLRSQTISGGFFDKKEAKEYLRDLKKSAIVEEDDGL